MLAIAFWVAIVLALLTTISAVVKAALEVDEVNSAKAETLSFLRMTLTGIFGVTLGQSLVPLGWSWWVTAIVSIVLMIGLLLGTQVAARKLGHQRIGRFLAKNLASVINSLHLFFTPLSLPKDEEPEEFEQEYLHQ